ncbi:MAG: ORF6N domain-containing protein [Candidatus Saganbacteria bacterium]|nr:ORF6N domain-containing protein [Candidatus Saganbacteria bacterium]
MKDLIPIERIEGKILMIRGQKVMLDRDIAGLYVVKTFVLNQAVKRNIGRFPEDFMFQLNKEELDFLRSQFVILEGREGSGKGRHIKYLPHAFTEQGIAMLSSVLHSERAIQVNILIMRTFVKLKQILSTHKELADKIRELEQKCDARFKSVFDAIHTLMQPPEERISRRIGFL